MSIEDFLLKLSQNPTEVTFDQTMQIISDHYDFTPTAFINGMIKNGVGENSGSCKLFAFAKLNKLNSEKTLACFGDFYRKDVLDNPDADNHQNIRNFISNGWDGIDFKGSALSLK